MRGHIAASEAAEEVLFRTLKVEPVLPWSLCLAPMLDWLFMRLVTTSNSCKEIQLIIRRIFKRLMAKYNTNLCVDVAVAVEVEHLECDLEVAARRREHRQQEDVVGERDQAAFTGEREEGEKSS